MVQLFLEPFLRYQNDIRDYLNRKNIKKEGFQRVHVNVYNM
jgi:hypothetical protein